METQGAEPGQILGYLEAQRNALREVEAIIEDKVLLIPPPDSLIRELELDIETWKERKALLESIRGPELGNDHAYTDESPDFVSHRTNARWLPFGRFIMNRFTELNARGLKVDAIASKIGTALESKFSEELARIRIEGSDVNSKALLRVRKAHEEGRLEVRDKKDGFRQSI